MTVHGSLLKKIRWHLLVGILKLDGVNDTGKPQKVRGSAYSVTVQPGQAVRFGRDEGYLGY